MTPIDLMVRLQEHGVAVSLRGDVLILDPPREALPMELREAVSDLQAELVDFVREVRETTSAQAMLEPVPRTGGGLPLSFAQERYWFLLELGEAASAHHLKYSLRLKGSLDVDAMARSLRAIVERHEALRTTFAIENGNTVQRVMSAPSNFELPVVDAASSPDPLAEALRRCKEEFDRPFALELGPPYRLALYRLGDGDHILSLIAPHLVGDGSSIDILFRELSALYGAYTAGHACELAPLKLQYADYAVWQRRQYAAERDRLLSFWRSNLSGLTSLDLPADRARPAVQTFDGRQHRFVIPRGTFERIAVLSHEQECTPFVTMLAAFQVLLQRYTDQDDIAVGVPANNRNRTEFESIVGPFLNTLVLRSDLSGNPRFQDLLPRVRTVVLNAFEHGEMPFEQLVLELRPERDTSRNPLFQVLFNQLYPAALPELGELRVETPDQEVTTSILDLSLLLHERHASFEYNTDLFDDATIEQMATHFLRVLETVVRDPNCRVRDIELLSSTERAYLVRDCNPTARHTADSACLHTILEERASVAPDAIALCDEHGELTLGVVNARANQLAHHLRSLGIGRGSIVGVALSRSCEAVIALLGALKAGAAWLPLEGTHPVERLAFTMMDAGADALVTRASVLEELSAALPVPATTVLLDRDADALAARGIDDPPTVTRADDLAYVIYTSGSTGRPKGVLGRHRGAVNRLRWMWHEYPFGSDEVCCQKTSLHFVDSIQEIFGPLLAGVPLVVIKNDDVIDTPRLLDALRDHRVTRLVAVPSLLRAMLDARGSSALPDLRQVISSGEVLSADLAHEFATGYPATALLNLYGFSEAAADATYYDLGAGLPSTGDVPIGRPIWNTQVYVVDAHGELAPVGVPGEICVAGDGLSSGYLHRPTMTAESFVPCPFTDRPGARMYRSGDLGRWSREGHLEYLRRRDDQVKIRGVRVEIGEVEHALRGVGGVRECAVVPESYRASGRGGAGLRLRAAVVLDPGVSVTVSELRAQLRRLLPEPMVPEVFVVVDALPRLPSGKVDRRELGAGYGGGECGDAERVAFAPPRTDTERTVARIWADVLGVDRVARDDNFVELGGHSLLAVQALSRLDQELGVRLRVVPLLAQTLCQVAEACDRARVGEDAGRGGGLLARWRRKRRQEKGAMEMGSE